MESSSKARRDGSLSGRLSASDLQKIVATLRREPDGVDLVRRLQATLALPACAGPPELHVRLLGGLAIRVGDRWENGPPPMRGRKLIAYLALHKNSVAAREALAEILSAGSDGEDSTHRLHMAASGARAYLRRALGGMDAIACVAGGYTWNQDLTVVTDVTAFLDASSGASEDLATARSLYRGDLLSGEEGDWIEPLRVRYAAVHATVLERMAEEAIARGEYDRALSVGLELVAFDRGHEGASRLVMRCFAVLGRRGRALAEFEALRAHLRKHLGLEPTAETRQLIRAILGHAEDVPISQDAPNFKV